MITPTKDIIETLKREANHFNRPEFIDEDPVKFPRMFTDKRDIEIASLLTSTIAWGNRKMICKNADKMFSLMDWQPYHYIMEQGFAGLNPNENIHRTFFNSHLIHYLKGLYKIYKKHGSLESMAKSVKADVSDAPAWHIAEHINHELALANDGKECSRCLPLGLDTSALKRFNMALRWLVRKDGIVDLGVWDVIKPSQLYIPLDVHVGNVSRALGLLNRQSNDRKAVVELTETLRQIDPEDPIRFDFALFSIGIESKKGFVEN